LEIIVGLNDNTKDMNNKSDVQNSHHLRHPSSSMTRCLNGFDFEVKSDQREDQTLEVLNQVIETSQAFRVFALVHINQRPDFAGRE